MITTAQLEFIAFKSGVPIINTSLPKGVRGYYAESIDGEALILLSDKLTPTERRCALAEELGHCMMNVGTSRGFSGHKQELIGRRWAYKQLAPPQSIRNAYLSGVENICALAEALEVTEEFLREAIADYTARGIQVLKDTQ